MTPTIVATLISLLCQDLEAIKPEYVIQGEIVSCMDYYTNDIISNPDKYKKELENVKAE
jgi:hypothetical protein